MEVLHNQEFQHSRIPHSQLRPLMNPPCLLRLLPSSTLLSTEVFTSSCVGISVYVDFHNQHQSFYIINSTRPDQHSCMTGTSSTQAYRRRVAFKDYMHGYIIETKQFCAHHMCITGFQSSTKVLPLLNPPHLTMCQLPKLSPEQCILRDL